MKVLALRCRRQGLLERSSRSRMRRALRTVTSLRGSFFPRLLWLECCPCPAGLPDSGPAGLPGGRSKLPGRACAQCGGRTSSHRSFSWPSLISDTGQSTLRRCRAFCHATVCTVFDKSPLKKEEVPLSWSARNHAQR